MKRVFFFFLCLTINSGNISASTSEGTTSQEGKTLFEQKCVACHTVGGGKKVGPDLKGVAERREEEWLKGFIKSPSSYFTSDETAKALLKEFSVPMPDLGLKENEVEALVAYLKDSGDQAGGSTTKPTAYLPTLLIAGGGILLLTLLGLAYGNKKVEVRS